MTLVAFGNPSVFNKTELHIAHSLEKSTLFADFGLRVCHQRKSDTAVLASSDGGSVEYTADERQPSGNLEYRSPARDSYEASRYAVQSPGSREVFASPEVSDRQRYRRPVDRIWQNTSSTSRPALASDSSRTSTIRLNSQSPTPIVSKQSRQIKGRPSKQPRKPLRQVKKYQGEPIVNLHRRGGGKKDFDAGAVESLLTSSPQLTVEGAEYPLLSTLLSPLPLGPQERQWIESHSEELKIAAGFSPSTDPSSLESSDDVGEQEPVDHLDDLLHLCFMHKYRSKTARHLKVAHSRLAYLGGFVADLAFAEYFLQRYPREVPASLRERVSALTQKKYIPSLLVGAGLHSLIFPEPLNNVPRLVRESVAKSVFCSLLATAYLTQGMPGVYRFLFQTLRLDPDAPEARPVGGRPVDEDHVVPELDGSPVTWQQVSRYQRPPEALFAHPLLFRACVPPGMHRFRGSPWFHYSLGPVLQALAYPRPSPPSAAPAWKQARNEELALALQLAFMHPSLYKMEHPRFCCERLEFLGSKIQDVVLAERLLQCHLDAPILWLEARHTCLLRNSLCGKMMRERKLEKHIIVSTDFVPAWDKNSRMRLVGGAATHQALHGIGYAVYGKAEVKRLLFGVWKVRTGGPQNLCRRECSNPP